MDIKNQNYPVAAKEVDMRPLFYRKATNIVRDNGLIVRALNCVQTNCSLFFSGEYYLGYRKSDLKGVSWYNLLHPECIKEVQSKHRLSKYLTTFLFFITKPLSTMTEVSSILPFLH